VNWDPYLDLETGVLRNRLGITDHATLAEAESDLTSYRLAELRESVLPGDYDLIHLRAFHRLIFGEVYDWAGELRTVSIGKGAPFCPPQRLISHADRVFSTLVRTDRLRGRDRAGFVDGLTGLLAEINYLHPFREGNGRTQRAFLGQLARAAGHPSRWTAMDPAANVTAARAAHLDGDTAPLRALLDTIVGAGR
jgi:cell filamentation protein